MANNRNQSLYQEDVIDLKEICKILIEFKKLIISSILIFTIASIIYSLSLKPSFESSTNLEIGYFTTNNVDRELIESPSALISDLNILLMKNPDGKFSQNVSISSFENKIINLATTSGSVEQNENLLTEIISFIDERHSNLTLLNTDQKKEALSLAIKLIESEISFIKDNVKLNLEAKILKLEADLPILEQEIIQLEQVVVDDLNNLNLLKGTTLSVERAAKSPTLEQIISNYKSQINALKRERNNSISDKTILSKRLDTLKKGTFHSDALFTLEQEQKILANQLQTVITQTQVKTRPIRNIETNTIKPKTQLIVSLGIIIGFITSIFLVFINNFIKSYRESEA
jgi:LPS O-antigen subunit length determinant protein (WzzB/FepE family)